MATLRAAGFIAVYAVIAGTGCTDAVTDLVSDDAGADARPAEDARPASDAAPEDAGAAEGGARDASRPDAASDAQPVLCNNKPCACDNGSDDDEDGLGDGLDPECTGPYDDDESSFATGSAGDNRESCQDCYFDGNSGHGESHGRGSPSYPGHIQGDSASGKASSNVHRVSPLATAGLSGGSPPAHDPVCGEGGAPWMLP